MMVPAGAAKLAATLSAVLALYWPGMQSPELLMGQSEQETCYSLSSPKCLNPHTVNDMPSNNGEYGFGVYQLTNTNSYNNFAMIKRRVPELADWQWADRFQLRHQVVAGVVMDYDLYRSCKSMMATDRDAYACMFAGYNGGGGRVLADRRLCGNTRGCNPQLWFGHVELTSTLSKRPHGKYAISPYSINRGYVRGVFSRAPKYANIVRRHL